MITIEQVVKRHIDKCTETPNGCLETSHLKNASGLGYPRTTFDGKVIKLHRASLMVYLGIPYEQYHTFAEVVSHDCDNPACINPEHLRVNTVAGNIAERDARGRRNAIGYKNGNNKLTNYQVMKIRWLRTLGRTYQSIANEFGVAKQSVIAICQRKTWKHI